MDIALFFYDCHSEKSLHLKEVQLCFNICIVGSLMSRKGKESGGGVFSGSVSDRSYLLPRNGWLDSQISDRL